MEQIELTAARRTVEKKAAKQLRQEGWVPCILYGYGIESTPLKIESLPLRRTIAQAGASQLIQLRIEDAGTAQPVLAREIQRDALNGEPIHVDFLAVNMTESITAEVSINLVGEPKSVATGLGLLLQGANTIEIECLPGDLIPAFDVDVSGLKINDMIYVSDIVAPPGITILSDPQEMVVQVVHEAREEEEEEEEELFAFEAPPDQVEVISRGKIEEEEEA